MQRVLVPVMTVCLKDAELRVQSLKERGNDAFVEGQQMPTKMNNHAIMLLLTTPYDYITSFVIRIKASYERKWPECAEVCLCSVWPSDRSHS